MILKTIRDMSQEKQSDVSATCVWVLLKLSKRRHFHWLKRTTDHKKAHFSESAALFAEILEKARLLLLKTTYLNLLQRYFNFRSTHSVQVSHHSDSESWWKHSDMLAILAIFLMKRKKDEKNSNLVAVNLHDRRPSSISTSKISHVTKNRDRFLAYDQSDQLTHVKLVTDTEFLKWYKLTLAIL